MPLIIENTKHKLDQVGDGYVIRQYLDNGLPTQAVSFAREQAREVAQAIYKRETELEQQVAA